MEVSFPAFDKSFDLFGTLTLPSKEEPAPAILIVAGSGPIDRGGNEAPRVSEAGKHPHCRCSPLLLLPVMAIWAHISVPRRTCTVQSAAEKNQHAF